MNCAQLSHVMHVGNDWGLEMKLAFFLSFFWCLIQSVCAEDSAARYRFPEDPSVLNVQRDFGAKGDGRADDTKALQRALEASCGGDPQHRSKSNAVWLPNGVYRVTETLVIKSGLGPWLYGESRDGVIIKLDDGAQNVTCVLRTHPSEKGPTSADWFMRNLRHFTIDVGNNPETDGIRYYATNSGCLKDVRVIGRGKIGVNAGFLDQSGPNLVQDVEIDGFETGLLSQWIWGETLSRIKIKNCRKVGLEVSANVVAVEDLVVENTPLAIENSVPNGWFHWGGMMALVGGRFSGGNSHGPAIHNAFGLYARDITSTGYGQVLVSDTERGQVLGNRIEEYLSFPGKNLFPGEANERSLNLPIQREPDVPWENDVANWLCLDDYGAVAGDNQDDSAAIENGLKIAAEKGMTVAYFRGCGGNDPNWFNLSRPITVPAPVRMVMGLGWARILRDKEGGFVVDDSSAPLVKFQNIDAFGGTPIQLTNASASNQLVVESCGVHVIGNGGGNIFMTDCPATIDLQKPGQKCWARQLNPEGDSDLGLIRNNGCDLWCLGVKHEGRGVRFATSNHGHTEVLGLFNYGGTDNEKDPRPCFDIADASFSVAALREIAFNSHTVLNKVRESRSSETRILDRETEGGWIGWTLYRGSREQGSLPDKSK